MTQPLTNQDLLREFQAAVTVPEAELNLARAALLIARSEYPTLYVDNYLTRLDVLAVLARQHFPSSSSTHVMIHILNQFLFDELRFQGNTSNYYDPRNSFLNDVLDRRTGIPITLSIVYLEIGWRLGLALEGVGFPGHFLVRYEANDISLLIDPFDRGHILSLDDCREMLRTMHGQMNLRAEYLESTTKHQILTRMLHNLRNVYLQQDQVERALAVLDRLLILNPKNADLWRERGVLNFRSHHFAEAEFDLERSLWLNADSPDANEMSQHLETIRAYRQRLN